jgi:DNA-binding winged helix-turn-helix (wHTH) protein
MDENMKSAPTASTNEDGHDGSGEAERVTKSHQSSPPCFSLGRWQVDPRANTLKSAEDTIRLQPRLMSVLVALAEGHPGYVSREELLRLAWRVEHLSPQALNNAVSKLRTALGDPDLIQTQRLDGYRLAIAPDWNIGGGKPRETAAGEKRWSTAFIVAATLFGSAAIVIALLLVSQGDDPLSQYLSENPGNWVVEVQEGPEE